MGSDWQKFSLSSVINLIGGGTPKKSVTEYWNGDIPWLSVKDFNDDYRHVLTSEESITELGLNKSSTKILDEGQIIISARGTVGALAQVSKQMAFNQSCYGIDAKPEYATNDFLYYLLKYSINNIKQITHGAVFDTITKDTFNHISTLLPPLPEQKSIAYILGSLDDKIELNRQINKTLESMAQALFKSWFVDFDPVIDNALAAGNPIPEPLQARAAKRVAWISDSAIREQNQTISKQFPSEFEFNEKMGWIPKGWEVGTLLDLIELIGGGTPKTSIDEYWNGHIPWFSVVDAPNTSDIFVIDTEKHITSLGVEKSSTKILPVGTTIISARGTVGKCAMVSRPMAMNQSCYGIKGKNNISDTFVYYTVLLQVSGLQQRSHGSIFSTITRDTFKSICVAFGGTDLTLQFDKIVNPYFDKILNNNIQSIELTKLRDTLLPKLLSGEIRIPDAEKLIAEAT